MTTKLVLVHALSPVHCGTGQAISGIDLPVARERATGTPLIPGSTLKGVLRAQPAGYGGVSTSSTATPTEVHRGAFGPETSKASEFAGAVQFADLHLVLLPIRSVRGTFAWVTSPHLLRRLRRDAQEAGLAWRFPADKPADSGALVAGDRLIVKIAGREQVVLEDFDFVPKKSNEVAGLAEDLGKALYGDDKDAILHLRERLCVVSDDVMRVLVRTGMEVTARNRIDGDTRTVAKGALWTEEALPAESVLSGMLVVTPVRATDTADELLKHVRSLCRGTVQLGGKASVGRGLCAVEVL